MTNVYFPKPRRFDVFKMMYINEQKRRHSGNSHWQTNNQVYDNLGGFGGIYDVFSAFGYVSSDAQKRICGFTDADINAFLDKEDAGSEYSKWCRDN